MPEEVEQSSRSPRVAIVLTELRPGGMERVVVHLANGLSRLGSAVLVACLAGEGDLAAELERPGVRLEALRSATGWDLGALWRLLRLLRRFRPSVLNVHDYASLPYLAVSNLFSGRAPILFTAHGLLYEGFERLRVRNRFFGRFIRDLSAVSEEVAERHKNYLAWRDPIDIIPNGVPAIERDEMLRRGVRVELGCRDDDFLFLAVGNPRPEKGFEDLVEAVRLLGPEPAEGRRCMVAVAGRLSDSQYCKSLLRRVEDESLTERCLFLGFRSDTRALYSAADALVLPSRSEGLPMVVLEAMMAGLPVIATRVGGVPDAVADCGLLVSPARPDEIAAAMKRLCEDGALAARLGANARVRALKEFSVDWMVDDYLACYQRLIRS
jgi:glycosyltransferase involved in cell wall biosynthesis